MKKTILFLSFACFSIFGFSQSQRTILLEEFTQASCPPCETTTPALNAIVALNAEKIVQVRYQTSWPGVDPMNADNPTEVADRVSYYGVTGVPNLRYDGPDTGSPGTITQAQIDQAYAVDAPVLIEVEHVVNDLGSMDVTVRIINEGTEAFEDANDKLRVALTEEVIVWPTPPGSTSLVEFEAVLKTFFTGTAGMDIPEIGAGETWENTWAGLTIPDFIYNYNQLSVVAWLQNDNTQAVHNSAASHPITLDGYADLGIESAAFNTADDLCDYEFSGEVTITNAGSAEVAQYDVNLLINGISTLSETITEPLAGGSTNTITFETISLPPGTSVIEYEVIAMGGDIATLNNGSEQIAIGKAGVASGLVEEGFESETVGEFASSTVVDMPFSGTVVNSAFFGGTGNLGGFGESSNSIWVNFWQWNPATLGVANGEIIVANQFLVPDVSSLSLDYAYTSWGGSQDRMQVQISTDCGATYTDLFNEAGSTLATAPELNANNAFFIPAATEWVNLQFDLADYVGQEVMIRFYFTSAWGDMLYLDNILLSNVVSTEDVLTDTERLVVYPNPTSTDLNIDLTLDTPSEISINLMDISGRTVMTRNIQGKQSELTQKLNVSDLQSGMYLLQIKAGEKLIVKNVNIMN